MVPIVYINCSLFPFVAWIMAGKKLYETRNRNTLKALIGKRVYIAITGGKKAVVACSATIESLTIVESKKAFNSFRKQTMIQSGSLFDWKPETKKKYLYKLSNVVPVVAFPVPENVVRHGRVYCEMKGGNDL